MPEWWSHDRPWRCKIWCQTNFPKHHAPTKMLSKYVSANWRVNIANDSQDPKLWTETWIFYPENLLTDFRLRHPGARTNLFERWAEPSLQTILKTNFDGEISATDKRTPQMVRTTTITKTICLFERTWETCNLMIRPQAKCKDTKIHFKDTIHQSDDLWTRPPTHPQPRQRNPMPNELPAHQAPNQDI